MKDYNNAVTALASGIDSTQRKLDRDEKVSIAEELLKHGPENHGNWNNLELNLSQESMGNLQEYHGNLQQAYSEEIGKEIKQTMEKVEKATDLRERLHSELNTALDETKELEEIAKRLQDRGIGNVAGKEERQVRELGKNLEKLDSKGEDLEKLENRLESFLNRYNLDKEDLHEELSRRAKALEKILDSAGSTGGGGQSDLNQIANRIIQKESKLQEAESRGLQQLEDDIKTLSNIVELEEQEITALRQVENYLQNGNFSQASSTLDSLIQRRERFGDQSRAVQQIKQDLQEEKKIIIALKEFFNSIKQLENKGISRDRLYQKMESQRSFSSAQEAKDFFTGLESEFEGIEEDIARVKKLEQKERKLESLEHEKLKEIDREDSELRKQASSQQLQQLKDIHEKVQRLGFSLENDIDTSDDKGSSGSEADDTNEVVEDWDTGGAEWREILDSPNQHIQSNLDLQSYGPQKWFSYPQNIDYPLPRQGFKLHITAYPSEGYDVCREIIPVLQDLGIKHKIMHSQSFMMGRINQRGSDGSQIKKFMTIYPKSSTEQIFYPSVGWTSEPNPNTEAFLINRENTVKIIEELLNRVDENVLKGGPKLEGWRKYFGTKFDTEEYRLGSTRIHLTYSVLGGGDRKLGKKDTDGDLKAYSQGIKPQFFTLDKNDDKVPKENWNGKDYGENNSYFLDHWVSKDVSDDIKENILNTGDFYEAILDKEGIIAGVHYLPPEDAIEEMKKIENEVI